MEKEVRWIHEHRECWADVIELSRTAWHLTPSWGKDPSSCLARSDCTWDWSIWNQVLHRGTTCNLLTCLATCLPLQHISIDERERDINIYRDTWYWYLNMSLRIRSCTNCNVSQPATASCQMCVLACYFSLGRGGLVGGRWRYCNSLRCQILLRDFSTPWSTEQSDQ